MCLGDGGKLLDVGGEFLAPDRLHGASDPPLHIRDRHPDGFGSQIKPDEPRKAGQAGEKLVEGQNFCGHAPDLAEFPGWGQGRRRVASPFGPMVC